MNQRLRFVLFVVVALAQLAVAGGAIVKSELALRTGEAFRFRIQPVDPVDAFRGRYVAIRFAVDRAPAPDDLKVKSGKHVFLPIEIDAVIPVDNNFAVRPIDFFVICVVSNRLMHDCDIRLEFC